jgi:hypothetical protein
MGGGINFGDKVVKPHVQDQTVANNCGIRKIVWSVNEDIIFGNEYGS